MKWIRKKNLRGNILLMFIISACFNSCKGQKPFGQSLLILQQTIPLPGVVGRIDHMDLNRQDQILYVSALGNQTLEVIDLRRALVVHTIRGLSDPQGVAYLPAQKEIFVANGGTGVCNFYNAGNFRKTGSIALPSDADNVRFEERSGKIFVGYGEGGIAEIDAATHHLVALIPLPAHAESFQISENRIFVNVPEASLIGVISLKKSHLLAKWPAIFRDNFPMALDSLHHRLFIGYWHPARMVVINSETGQMIQQFPTVEDADDFYYDPLNHNLYISGGAGYINIFHQQTPDRYEQVANIATQSGARTSLLLPREGRFILAERSGQGHGARIQIYRVK
ncbi:MAG: YncE family protein [Chitinophagaceae bacterium]